MYEEGVEPTRLYSQLGLNEPRLPFQHTYTANKALDERGIEPLHGSYQPPALPLDDPSVIHKELGRRP